MSPPNVTSSPSQRLLILDDDPMTGQTIQMIAELAGLEVNFTTSPDEFFTLLDHWAPTHIALDLVMPEMDGVQVMAKLAELSCQAKIIITSGVGGRILNAAGRSAAEHGLDIVGTLPKPFTASDLRTLLQEGAPIALTGSGSRASSSTSAPAASGVTVTALELALAHQELFVVYQPKVSCQTGMVAGFEALVRWAHPTLGMISPDRFVPLAETSGLIDALTDQVIHLALSWFAPLCLSDPSDRSPLDLEIREHLQLSVNISAKTLSNGALFERVRQRCEEMHLSPRQLIFELTETSAMDDPVASLDLLTRLRIKGFSLSIDDFGTGFSSMVQLVRLPFSEIKVDKSFVMTAMESQESRTVTKFIVDLGHSLGLRCTAEGVENASTLAYLQRIGCDLAQGYFIAKPMNGERALQWLAQYNASALFP